MNSRDMKHVVGLGLLTACVFMATCWLENGKPCNAANGWPDERQAGPFHFHADFSLQGHGKLVAQMAALQRELMRTLGVEESREAVHLFLFAQKSTYQGYMKQYFPSVPFRRALFIKRRGPGMVFAYANRDFEIDVRHESTHALLHAVLSHVPLWLDEGLAEYFEVPPEKRAYDNPHLKTLNRELFFGIKPNIEALEKIESLDKMGSSQYRQAWAWVHFMLHGPAAAHDELVKYFDDIENAVPTGKLSERLRRRIPDLDRKLVEHFKNWHRP